MTVNHTQSLGLHVHGRDPLLESGALADIVEEGSAELDFASANAAIALEVCSVANTGGTTQGAVDRLVGAFARILDRTGLLPEPLVDSITAAREMHGLNRGGISFAAGEKVGICLAGGHVTAGCFTFHGEHATCEFCPKCHTPRYAHLAGELVDEQGPAFLSMSTAKQKTTRKRNQRVIREKGDLHFMHHWPLKDFLGDLLGNHACNSRFALLPDHQIYVSFV